jgi:hypothetical protein
MTARAEQQAATAPIAAVVIRSGESLDFAEFLRRYARAIVEVKGTGPAAPTLHLSADR